jgi:hypothetical protein
MWSVGRAQGLGRDEAGVEDMEKALLRMQAYGCSGAEHGQGGVQWVISLRFAAW